MDNSNTSDFQEVNTKRNNYRVDYLDCNNDILYTKVYTDKTYEEVNQLALDDIPKDRFIEDYTIVKLI